MGENELRDLAKKVVYAAACARPAPKSNDLTLLEISDIIDREREAVYQVLRKAVERWK